MVSVAPSDAIEKSGDVVAGASPSERSAASDRHPENGKNGNGNYDKMKPPTTVSKTRGSPVRGLLFIGFSTLCWMLVTTFAAPPLGVNSGKKGGMCVGTPTEGHLCLCPRETVCATKWHEVAFLIFARASAYFDYPMYMLLFLSKCHNLRGFLYRTHLREWIPLSDMHNLHAFAGAFVSFEVVWHSFWHVTRWGLGGNIEFLWTNRTGITGLVSLLVTPLIAYPMMFRQARISIPFGYRKAMHYLSIVWGICIMFHAPKTNIFWVLGPSVVLYLLDYIAGYVFCIRYCPTLKLTRLGETAVEIVFEHPPGFVNDGGGYVYICLPWLGVAEWHAFSLYAHPALENHSSVCVAKLGDWTAALHEATRKPCSKPGWVYGPFPSPFSSAGKTDNLVGVANGIGISPTLGLIKQLSSARKVNVVWMTRDADLIEYFVRTVQFDDDAWTVIYYTGKRKLVMSDGAFKANPRMLLIQGRPNLRKTILDVMSSIERDAPLPREMMDAVRDMHMSTLYCGTSEKFASLLRRMQLTYSMGDLYQMAMRCTLAIFAESSNDSSLSEFQRGVTLSGMKRFIDEVGNAPGLLDEEQVSRVFRQLDTSGDGFLDRQEFAEAMHIMEGSAETDEEKRRRSTENHRFESQRKLERAFSSITTEGEEEEEEDRTRAGLGGQDVDVRNWQILYCGGTKQVVETLERIGNEIGVDVQIESFEW